MKLQIPLKYSDLFALLQNNWDECVGSAKLEECGSMDDDSKKKKCSSFTNSIVV